MCECDEFFNGDVNQDGSVDIFDIIQIVNHILGVASLGECAETLGDWNGDGSVNVTDIVQVAISIVN